MYPFCACYTMCLSRLHHVMESCVSGCSPVPTSNTYTVWYRGVHGTPHGPPIAHWGYPSALPRPPVHTALRRSQKGSKYTILGVLNRWYYCPKSQNTYYGIPLHSIRGIGGYGDTHSTGGGMYPFGVLRKGPKTPILTVLGHNCVIWDP